MNAHDAIVQAVLAALRTVPAVTSGPIDEDLDALAIADETTQAISVSLVGSDPQNPAAIFGHPVDWISTLVVECYARRDSAVVLTGRASRALHAAAYARLMADPTLGGVADDLREPSIAIDNAVLDTRMGCCTGTYPVLHRTAARSLQAPS